MIPVLGKVVKYGVTSGWLETRARLVAVRSAHQLPEGEQHTD